MKIHLRAFKQNLKLLLINKKVFIFLIIFSIGNLFLHTQYVGALKSFALSEKVFSIADTQKSHAIDLLSNEFTCETKQAISGCYNYLYILLLLFILLEGFVIYSFIKNRRTVSKKILVGYSVFLQLLLIVPLLALAYAPYRAFDILGQQANK